VIGEVGFPEDEETGEIGHEVIIDPETAHRVVDGGVDAHGLLVGIFGGDLFVDFEEIAVALADGGFAEALDGIGEIEIDAETAWADAAAVVGGFFGGAGGDIAWGEVAEAGVFAFEIVIAFGFGDLGWGTLVAFIFGDPDASVVAEGLGHEGEFALILAGDGDAGGVDLGVAGVGEEGAVFVGAPGGGGIGAFGVGGEVEDISVAACAEDHGVGGVRGDGTGDEIANDDAFGMAVDEDEIEQFGTGEHFDGVSGDLAIEGGVSAEEELLAGLAAGVESAGDLGTTEGAIGEEPTVFAGEGDALGDALIDDRAADFGEAMDIGFAGAEVAAFDGIVEEALDGIAVVLVIFSGVDASLGGDGVGASWGILEAEAFDLVAEFAEGGGGAGASEAGADDDDFVFSAIGGVDQFGIELMIFPLIGDGTCGNFGIERGAHYLRNPVRTARGMDA